MICPSCKKSQPMTFRCRSCGAELMRGRYRDGESVASARSSSAFRAPAAPRPAQVEAGLHNPYAAPQARTFTSVRESHALAGRGARLAAALIDVIATGLVVSPLMLGVGLDGASPGAGSSGLLILGLLALGAFAVYQIRLLITEGQTLGKKVMSIRIVDYDDGTLPSASQVFLRRYVLNGLLGNIPLYSLLDVLLIFGAERRCIHDYLAGTKVVDA